MIASAIEHFVQVPTRRPARRNRSTGGCFASSTGDRPKSASGGWSATTHFVRGLDRSAAGLLAFRPFSDAHYALLIRALILSADGQPNAARGFFRLLKAETGPATVLHVGGMARASARRQAPTGEDHGQVAPHMVGIRGSLSR